MAGCVPEIRRAPGDAPPQLSFGQERFLRFVEQGGDRPSLHASHLVRLTGSLDPGLLEHCLRQVVARHQPLRCNFRVREGHRAEIVSSELETPFAVESIDGIDAARARACQDAQIPYDLEFDPLLRCRLMRIDDDEHVLALTAHHIASDAGSWSILTRDLFALYAAARDRRTPQVPVLPVEYPDFAAWQRALVPIFAADHGPYWERCLASGSPPALPVDFPTANPASDREERCHRRLSSSADSSVAALVQDQRCTPFMVMFAAFAVVLHQSSGQERFVVGVPFSQRNHLQLRDLCGYFGNPLAIAVEITGDMRFSDLLSHVREQCAGAYAHAHLPVAELPGLDPRVFYGTRFNFVPVWSPPQLGGLTVARLPPNLGQTPFDLSLYIVPARDQPSAMMRYRAEQFAASTIERMLIGFENVLLEVGRNASQRISALPGR